MTRNQALVGAAAVTAVGTIIVALISYFGRTGGGGNGNLSTPVPDIQYTGRVVDKETQRAVQGALVIVETQGPPQKYHTDGNGVFYTRLSPDVKAVRVKVEADGYKVFDNNVAPASRTGLEDIRLEKAAGGPGVGLPDGLTLKGAIEFVAERGKTGVKYVGNCNPRFMQAKVRGGEFQGKDWGDIIEQLQYRLVNSSSKSGYRVTKTQEGVYQIECTN